MILSSAIGFFDSGIGGLSIWQAVTKMLPTASTCYFADTKYAPYGGKPKHLLLERCHYGIQYLVKQGCQLIVVACNTATTNTIATLRAIYPNITFVGVEPATKPAAMLTKKGVVGVLATQSTLDSPLFAKTVAQHLKGIKLVAQHGEGLVALIEKGQLDSKDLYHLLNEYLRPIKEAGADCLVLGCTHYPFLIPMMSQITGGKITIIDPALAVAKRVASFMTKMDFVAKKNEQIHRFSSSGDTDLLAYFLEKMGLPIADVSVFFDSFV